MRQPAKTKLSPRQQETLGHLLTGEGEKRIAFLLGISVNTVHTYVRHIYRTFNVHSRCELMKSVLDELLAERNDPSAPLESVFDPPRSRSTPHRPNSNTSGAGQAGTTAVSKYPDGGLQWET